MNMLVMPLSKARVLIPLWNHTEGSNVCFAIIGFILFIVSMCLVCYYDDLWHKERHSWTVVKIGAAIAAAILGLSFVLGNMHANGKSTRDHNVGAIYNVGAYHKMKHLQKIYPSLPCQSHVNDQACKTKSISKATNYRNKHTFTKSQASKEYNQLKKAYRHTNGMKTTNNTKSLHPTKPRWWNYIWG